MLNLFTRKHAPVPVVEPTDPVPIVRQVRPVRPAPDMLTVRRTALRLATQNLTTTMANRAVRAYDREDGLPHDVTVVTEWLVKAPDRDDYDTRVQALDTQITIYGAAEYWVHGTRSVRVRAGEHLVRKARAIYQQLIAE
ncbi:hypothetical protein ACWDRB_47495 [Nonomuraea sp. NPDC003707]